jgi:hypothetical protein
LISKYLSIYSLIVSLSSDSHHLAKAGRGNPSWQDYRGSKLNLGKSQLDQSFQWTASFVVLSDFPTNGVASPAVAPLLGWLLALLSKEPGKGLLIMGSEVIGFMGQKKLFLPLYRLSSGYQANEFLVIWLHNWET